MVGPLVRDEVQDQCSEKGYAADQDEKILSLSMTLALRIKGKNPPLFGETYVSIWAYL